MSKILVADDNAATVILLKTVLELDGYQVVTAAMGRQVLQLVQDEQPDAVIIDFHLGNESGLDVLRQIRETPAAAKTPVILSSALDHSYEAEKAGADAFLLKPFGSADLRRELQKMLGRSD